MTITNLLDLYMERVENLKKEVKVSEELLENLKSQRELVEEQKKAIELYLKNYER